MGHVENLGQIKHIGVHQWQSPLMEASPFDHASHLQGKYLPIITYATNGYTHEGFKNPVSMHVCACQRR